MKTILLLVTLFCLSASAAESPELRKALDFYASGAYTQALGALAPLKQTGETRYWQGLSNSRLQRFEKAASDFSEARRLGHKSPDLDYELGQALYASRQLKPAREAFKRSASTGFKPGASRFYVGFISQVLEELSTAQSAYQSLSALPRAQDTDKVKQPAMLQLAELSYSQARSISDVPTRHARIRTEVLPRFETAMNYETGTAAHDQARAQVSALRALVGADGSRFENGTPIPTKLWVIRATQDTRYDSNVVAEADQAATRVSNAASVVSRTAFFAKVEHIVANRWSVSPDATLEYTRHLNRNEPSVYANDQLSVTPALRLRNEHRYKGKPAAAFFDVEFNNLARDTNQLQTLTQYSRYFNFVAGERARFLTDQGNLTLQASFKVLTHSDDDQSAIVPGITAFQNLPMGGRNNLTLTVGLSDTIAKVDTYSRLSPRVGANLALADLVWDLYANVGFDLILDKLLSDTQSAARGLEMTIAPTLSFRKDFTPGFFAGLGYSFTKQVSDDEATYAYTKHTFGLNLGALL